MLWNEGEAAQWETPADFPAKPSLFTYQGRAFSLEDRSHFRNSLIPVRLEHPLPSPQQKRHKHHFNSNISLFATEAMHFPRDERTC